MKRTAFVKHLRENHCSLKREGSKHSIFENKINGKLSAVPRHSELADKL
jgi:mRNA interferase HicA